MVRGVGWFGSIHQRSFFGFSDVNVLIVEDEMLVAADLEATIEELGHTPVGIAPDLETAVQFACEGVDLALVDLNLRDGETGPMIGSRLASAGIMVIFVTGNPRAIGAGVVGTLGVFTKPLTRAGITSLINYAAVVARDPAAPVPDGLQLFEQQRR